MLNVRELTYGELPFDGNHLYDWLMDAKPGHMISYYRGNLSADRHSEKFKNERRINFAADILLSAADGGLVSLSQIRKGESDFLYIARRSKQQFSSARIQDGLKKLEQSRAEAARSEDSKKRKAALKKATKAAEIGKGETA